MSKFITQEFLMKITPYLPDWYWLNRWIHIKLHSTIHNKKPQSIQECGDLNDYWLMFKSNPHSSIFGFFVDKDLVKDFIKVVIGQQYVIPTLMVTDEIEKLKSFTSPEDFVIKPTHSCKDILFKKSNTVLTPQEIQACIHWMKMPIYRRTREYQCKYLKPKYIVEPRLSLKGEAPSEFTFLTINGEVQYIIHHRERHGNRKMQWYSPDWQQLNIRFNNFEELHDPIDQPKPNALDEMLGIAQRLGSIFPLIRVDLMLVDQGIKFSELTFTPANATQKIEPPEFYQGLWKKVPISWPKRIL